MEETWEKEVVSVGTLQSEDPQVKGALKLQAALEEAGKYSYMEQAQQFLGKHETYEHLTIDGEHGGRTLAEKLAHMHAKEKDARLVARLAGKESSPGSIW